MDAAKDYATLEALWEQRQRDLEQTAKDLTAVNMRYVELKAKLEQDKALLASQCDALGRVLRWMREGGR